MVAGKEARKVRRKVRPFLALVVAAERWRGAAVWNGKRWRRCEEVRPCS